ncbi:spinster family MFS transporter [Sphingobium sp. B11D3D]|uniref:spinster family MFS transporter n=1 Tax=Sphingobium sp. B11D3D TaxID=2940576 RepID=UPI00222597E4|nr:MFS transporter [Sphingobium sp. B11D3D]MCW2368616.1 MFS family permease [Sphingobium sp. B11D3D]
MTKTQHGGAWVPGYTLFLLFVSNVFNYADRALLGIVVDPVKADLQLSDTAMSLVSGTAFVLFNLIIGIFIARWVDHGNRKKILLLGVAIWSGATALTGLAEGFVSLALTRVLVGVGEATAFPVAISVIADLYPKDRRPRALGIYQSSAFVGIVGGSIAAGILAAIFGWRTMFFICGGAGLAFVLLLALTMKEPPRGMHDEPDAADIGMRNLPQSIRFLLDVPGFRMLAVGMGISAMGAGVLPVWAPAFLLRSHGVSLAEVGALIAPSVGLGGIAGAIASGFMASYFTKKHGREIDSLMVPLIALPLSIPFFIAFCFAPSLALTLGAAAIMNFLLSSGITPCFSAAMGLATPQTRAVASMLLLASSGIIGSALAPLVVGAASDALTPQFGTESLRYAMSAVTVAPLLGCVFLWLAYRRARATTMAETATA